MKLKLKGFSLIELLVSITIVSLLMAAAFAVLRPQDYFARARNSRRISDLKVIQTAMEQFYANNNAYPTTASVPLTGTVWTSGSVTYLRTVPKDPGNGGNYCYATTSTGYEACANFENLSAPPTGFVAPDASCAGVTACATNPF